MPLPTAASPAASPQPASPFEKDSLGDFVVPAKRNRAGMGRRAVQIAYGEPRNLTNEDLAALWQERSVPPPPRLKALRHQHHVLARAVAEGKSLLECGNLTGMSVTRISTLKSDPAFQELVSFYSDELNEVFVDVHKRMAVLGTGVLEELSERFEIAPESFSRRELMELFSTMVDRSIATAKGGPAPLAQAPVPGGGVNLQINFVSPSQEAAAAASPQLETALPLAAAPPSLLPASEAAKPLPQSAPSDAELIGMIAEAKRQRAEQDADEAAAAERERAALRAAHESALRARYSPEGGKGT